MSTNRISQIAEAIGAAGIDAFFGWSEATLSYMRGLHEEAGHRFLTLGLNSDGREAFICGALSETQARRAGISDIRPWKDGEDPIALFTALADEWNLRSGVIAVDEDMPALHLLRMQAALPAALFRDGGPILANLRRTKTAAELALLKKAADIADATFDDVWPKVKPGMTERQVEQMLFEGMESRGGTVNFGIIGAGPGGAEPHHVTGDTVLKEGDAVIMDFGCDVEGWRSDITRTIGVGGVSDKVKQIYKIVYEAHHAGRKAIKPGVPLQDADSAARAVIEGAGYGQFFMHRLGHGIGLHAHEMPYLVQGADDPFRIADCFSIEPGIYLPGEFGVRLENIYHCTENGAESFNAPISPDILVS